MLMSYIVPLATILPSRVQVGTPASTSGPIAMGAMVPARINHPNLIHPSVGGNRLHRYHSAWAYSGNAQLRARKTHAAAKDNGLFCAFRHSHPHQPNAIAFLTGNPVVSENQICLRFRGLPLGPNTALHGLELVCNVFPRPFGAGRAITHDFSTFEYFDHTTNRQQVRTQPRTPSRARQGREDSRAAHSDRSARRQRLSPTRCPTGR
jgi:hypothetical protein